MVKWFHRMSKPFFDKNESLDTEVGNMKKLYIFLSISFLCLFLFACGSVRQRVPFAPSITDRTAAVIEIAETERSKIDLPPETSVTTQPQYYEVVATAASSASTTPKPVETEAPKEYFTVKFVDTDGYTSISLQTVVEGGSAVPPVMPEKRGDLIFRGWDKDYTNIRRGTIVKAIYQKEWLTVRFFDADASLIKTEQVRYGESATSPEMEDKPGYLFDGWNTIFSDVTEDMDVYATYYAVPVRKYITLSQAYELCKVTENTEKLPAAAYYRRLYENVLTVGRDEYAGNILYGSFSDTLSVEGFGFTGFEGMLVLKGFDKENEVGTALRLYIYVDEKQVFSAELTRPGAYKSFAVDLTDAKTLTIKLEPIVDNFIYYQDAEFIGGLVNAVLYEN